ncbi:MAG: RluA family pseudouridine synthase, partial [Ruminococcus sp.]|nr:RluA family pseudouridine synthase [Candidatus Copronaster equi]
IISMVIIMGRKISYKIPPEYDGKKVISYLKGSSGVSARLLKKLKRIENGITLNGEHIRTIDIIHTGDVLQIELPCPDGEIEPIDIPIDIIYEDDDLVIINKSPFLACHPTHNHQGDTLANALAFHLKSKGKQSVFRAIGRLDKGTSGIVICALNAYSAAEIPKTVQKQYCAVVKGKTDKNGTINKPIYRPDPMKTLRAVGENGDEAITHWELIKQNDKISFVNIKLETGRTHQIRVHFSSIGMPLMGDSMYGTDELNLGHQLLHCCKIEFIHPVTREKMTITAPPPPDMQKIIDNI